MNLNGIEFAAFHLQFLVGTKNFTDIIEFDVGSTFIVNLATGGQNFQGLAQFARTHLLTIARRSWVFETGFPEGEQRGGGDSRRTRGGGALSRLTTWMELPREKGDGSSG